MNIIITGASRGIGFELVKKFSLNAENHVLALSRSEQGLNRVRDACLAQNPNAKVEIVIFDVVAGNYHGLLEHSILPFFKGIDILINNAGFLVNKPLAEITEEDFNKSFDVNVKAVFKLVKLLQFHFSKGGHIVNIASMGGLQGSAKFPGLSVYSASKGALAVLTESLAVEMNKQDLSINCLALGAVQTEMFENAFPGHKAPLVPGQMADFIYDFALNGNKYFNGKILPVSLSTP